ncbi:MAG: band 7 protein [Sandaracinaceae bacterium]|nr:band 7 protein [Sandaracinaceae bacterium]
MADIRSYWFVRHLRADSSSHVLVYKNGTLVRSGRGLSLWFFPLSTSLAEVPTDDREVALSAFVRSSDFQDLSVQGTLTYRVIDASRLAERVDFSIDTRRGAHLRQPLDKLALQLGQLAQQEVAVWASGIPLRDALRQGPAEVRARIAKRLESESVLEPMGLAIASVHVASVMPSNDLERALEAPMRERIQQEADEAAFARRALAVEKERAIAENELQNRIELARREEQLISQEGANQKRKVSEEAESKRIAAEGDASRARLAASTQAETTRAVEGAKIEQEKARSELQTTSVRALEMARVEAERARMDMAREIPPAVLAALAAKELAGKLQRIEHVHLGGDALGSMLTDLVTAGTRVLEAAPAASSTSAKER